MLSTRNENMCEIDKILRMLKGPPSLNLFPTENRMSALALSALSTDAVHRYPFSEDSDSFYGDTGRLTEMADGCAELAKRYFDADSALIEGLSGLNIMHWILNSILSRGDTVLIMDPRCGGHYATQKICEDFGFNTAYIPFDRTTLNIDVDKLREVAKKHNPRLMYIDSSTLLTIPDIPKIREAVGEDVRICLDASQILAFVPLDAEKIGPSSGLDILNGSTHKSFPGPQKGLVLTNKSDVLALLNERMPYEISSAHPNSIGALAITLLELMPYKRTYPRDIRANAKKLSEHLAEQGFLVPGEHIGFTDTQQIWIEPFAETSAHAWADQLRRAHVRTTVVPLPSSGKPGLRIGVQELTRMGMKEDSMMDVAIVLKDCLISKVPSMKLKRRISNMCDTFKRVQYAKYC